MIGWNFPLNNGGQIQGPADSGIVTFKGNPIKSLTREICQNSLDAAADENSVVNVEFESYTINADNVPGYSDYQSALENCKDYWSDSNDYQPYFKNAVNQISGKKISVMRISDYNTTGLSEPYDKNSKGGWNTLTIIDGGAIKSGEAAGSFGIGKNAPFANSDFNLVFYRTLNQKGEKAAQGLSRLPSFKKDNGTTSGVGYYGDTSQNLPVKSISQLDDIKSRNKVGTDVFIYGFNGDSSWQEEVFIEVLENFLIAIYNKKLSVTVQGKSINFETLGNWVENYKSKAQNAYNYYRVLTEEITEFAMSFNGSHIEGRFRLKVLVDSSENLNRKLLVVRKSGMKLFEMKNISRSMSFTGILSLEGKKLNQYFRAMETASHDKWEPKQHTWDKKNAKFYVDEVNKWVKESIRSLGEKSTGDEVAAEGLSNILQMNNENIENKSDNKKETLTDDLNDIIIEEVGKTPSAQKIDNVGGMGNYGSKFEVTSGIIDKNGNFEAERTLKGNRKRKRKTSHKGIETPDGDDIIKKPIGTPVDIKNVRIVKTAPKTYRMSFESPKFILEGNIEIMTIGENGKTNRLNVIAANAFKSCSAAQAVSDKIAFTNLDNNGKVKIEFTLQDDRDYAMEVNIYENN